MKKSNGLLIGLLAAAGVFFLMRQKKTQTQEPQAPHITMPWNKLGHQDIYLQVVGGSVRFVYSDSQTHKPTEVPLTNDSNVVQQIMITPGTDVTCYLLQMPRILRIDNKTLISDSSIQEF